MWSSSLTDCLSRGKPDNQSVDYSSRINGLNEIMDVTQTAVREKMLSHNIKCLIHGHTHRPDIHEYSFGKRIVLGDWSKLGWYLFLDEDGFDLRSFSLN